MREYKIKVKNTIKELSNCSQEEILEGLIDLHNLKKEKDDKIEKMQMQILDLESEMDDLQRTLSHKKRHLEEEITKQLTRDNIIQALTDHCNNPVIKFTQFVCTKLEEIQE